MLPVFKNTSTLCDHVNTHIHETNINSYLIVFVPNQLTNVYSTNKSLILLITNNSYLIRVFILILPRPMVNNLVSNRLSYPTDLQSLSLNGESTLFGIVTCPSSPVMWRVGPSTEAGAPLCLSQQWVNLRCSGLSSAFSPTISQCLRSEMTSLRPP